MNEKQVALMLDLALAKILRQPKPFAIALGHIPGYGINGLVRLAHAKTGNIFISFETKEAGVFVNVSDTPIQTTFPERTDNPFGESVTLNAEGKTEETGA